MPIPPKEVLRPLTAAEEASLERTSRASSERADRVRRATALLVVAGGASFTEAARHAGLGSSSTISRLVQRFNRQGLAALAIAPGCGRTPTYDAAARARIVATAQRPPTRNEDGTGDWSLRLLERALRREDGFDHLGAPTIRRVLTAAGSSYQKTRTWCPTGTAERQRTSGVVTVTDPRTEEQRGPSSRPIG